MTFDEAINELRTYLELPDLKADFKGTYSLVLDDVLEIDVFKDKRKEEIIVSAIIVDLPPTDKREQFLKNILKINLARSRVENEYLSVDSANQTLIMYRVIPLHLLELDDWLRYFECFVESLEQWQKIVQDILDQSSTYNPVFPLYP